MASGRHCQDAGKGEGVRGRCLPLTPCYFFRIYPCISAFDEVHGPGYPAGVRTDIWHPALTKRKGLFSSFVRKFVSF